MSNSTHSTNKIIFFSGKINLSVKFNAASQTMWKCSDMRWVISRSHITHENSFLMRFHFDVKPSSQHSAVALCIFSPPKKSYKSYAIKFNAWYETDEMIFWCIILSTKFRFRKSKAYTLWWYFYYSICEIVQRLFRSAGFIDLNWQNNHVVRQSSDLLPQS